METSDRGYYLYNAVKDVWNSLNFTFNKLVANYMRDSNNEHKDENPIWDFLCNINYLFGILCNID